MTGSVFVVSSQESGPIAAFTSRAAAENILRTISVSSTETFDPVIEVACDAGIPRRLPSMQREQTVAANGRPERPYRRASHQWSTVPPQVCVAEMASGGAAIVAYGPDTPDLRADFEATVARVVSDRQIAAAAGPSLDSEVSRL